MNVYGYTSLMFAAIERDLLRQQKQEAALLAIAEWLAPDAGPFMCEHCGELRPVDDAERILGDIQHQASCPYRIALDALEGK